MQQYTLDRSPSLFWQPQSLRVLEVHAVGLPKELGSFLCVAHPHQGNHFLFKGAAAICFSSLHILMTTAQSTTGCPPQHTRPRESWRLTLLSWASGVLAVRTMGAVT